MADTRVFSDIEFINKTPDEIFSEMVSDWEAITGRTLGQADPIRIMIGWEASIDAQLYAAINESAKLNVPRFSYGTYLDSIAENYHHSLNRLEPSAATTTLRFTLTEESETDTIIPAGTRATADGSAVFETVETKYITAGSLYADVDAVCREAGTIGNGFRPGTIKSILDPGNVKNLKSVENITESEGGSNRETDEDFYNRMRQSMGAYSTAGSINAYKYHVKSANSSISGVKVTRPEPGCVDAYVMLQGGKLPGTEMLKEIEEHISADDVRPLTDNVTVKAPTVREFDIDVSWYIQTGSGYSRQEAEERVQKAVEQYVQWQTAEIGRDINPSKLTELMMNTGIKRVTVKKPEFQVVGETEAAVLGQIRCVLGGEEDA